MKRTTVFSFADLSRLEAHGISPEMAYTQLERFETGFPWLKIERPARAGDGVRVVTETEATALSTLYDRYAPRLRAVKFVPASGAATRMFKSCYAFLSGGRPDAEVERLLTGLDRFAFAPLLRKLLEGQTDAHRVVAALVGRPGLGYGSLPKAFILFHRYPCEVRTALEEHFVEAAAYAAGGGTARLHFTLSPEYAGEFETLSAKAAVRQGERSGVLYEVGWSAQMPYTDTLAVDEEGMPFRNADGSLLLRPAGHGALIENLNGIDADLIFIKNIDNVTTDALRGDTVRYKKVLAGLLVKLQRQVFDYLDLLDREEEPPVAEVAEFLATQLCVELPASFYGLAVSEQTAVLRERLDRPLRVCGMVRNDGEPGGGPFWGYNDDGSRSLQIVESSQIDPARHDLLRASTHFNPVDLVCSTRDRKGRSYDLRRYVDPQTGFITVKSKDGRELRALELPGLWNGAMSRWNTVFVEVPLSTFTPVKVVTDLLRPQHQPDLFE